MLYLMSQMSGKPLYVLMGSYLNFWYIQFHGRDSVTFYNEPDKLHIIRIVAVRKVTVSKKIRKAFIVPFSKIIKIGGRIVSRRYYTMT